MYRIWRRKIENSFSATWYRDGGAHVLDKGW
jgi:hypothetical protein